MDKNFVAAIVQLKSLRRSGWVSADVDDPESVADHSYSTTMMSAVMAIERGLDVKKVVLMALVHDLAEGVVGDVTPSMHIPKAMRRIEERKALEGILSGLEDDMSKLFLSLFDEYEERMTSEAKVVRNMDILDRMLQAKTYMRRQTGLDLTSFHTKEELEKITDPDLRKFFEQY